MIRAARVSIVASVVLAVHLQAQAPAPAPQATFRGGTDLVQVDISVLDGKRRPVRGLTVEEFTVFEDGQPRQIQAFTEVTLPERVQARDVEWTREVPRDVATNQVAHEEGRLVVILLDRTIPAGEPTITARRIAGAAIDQLGPRDLAAVVSTSNGAVQNLTSDRARLRRAITGSDLSTDITDEAKAIEASVFAMTGRSWSTLNDGRCQCGLCVLETITRVAEAVEGATSRRKVLFFVGSDLLLQSADAPGRPSNDVGCQNRVKDAREAMFTAVDRAHLTIHALDPSGLANVNPTSRASSPLRPGSGPFGAAVLAGSTADHLQRQGNLQVLPDRTGGRAVMNTNGPDLALPELFRESGSYYLIGFRPGEPGRRGSFHRITVKTTRRGLDVRARSGYIAAPAEPAEPAEPVDSPATAPAIPERVRDALTGLLPAGTIPIEVNAAAFALPGTGRASIALTVGVSAFAPARSAADGSPHGPLEVVATAFDQGGRQKGMARQALELSWPASAAAGEPRFEALSRLDLPPGEYEVRVAVSGATRTASVFSYVTVPAFAVAPLSISNIVVVAGAGTLTAPRDFLSSLLPLVPTAQREFVRTDRFVAFFRIYQGTARPDPLASVQLHSTVLDARGIVVANETSTIDSRQFAAGRTAGHYLTIPLATLAPGDYLLRVEATMGARVAGRALRFTVRPSS